MDLSLAKLPGRFVWNRGKREWRTTIPVILRNLAPRSGFDPQEVWKREQKLEEEERQAQNNAPAPTNQNNAAQNIIAQNNMNMEAVSTVYIRMKNC